MTSSRYQDILALDPRAIRCPFPAYARLRDEAPVRFVEEIGAYAVSRYDDILAVFKDTATFSSSSTSGPNSATARAQRIVRGEVDMSELSESEQDRLVACAARRLDVVSRPVLNNADPPLHSRQRRLVNHAFRPRRIAALETSIARITSDLIDRFITAGEVELVSQFCVPLPLTVIAVALGVPDGDFEKFREWSDAFVLGPGNADLSLHQTLHMLDAMNEFYDCFADQVRDRQRTPRDDLLTDVVNAHLDGDELTFNEQLQIVGLFLVAGNETTANLLASAVLRLLSDPALMASVRADRDLIPQLAEEVLRLDPPSSAQYRVVVRDTELGGVSIPAGSFVLLPLTSANHDERRFPHPDDLDLDRPPSPNHLSFGWGEHFCLGAPLARAEVRIGLDLLLERLDDITLVGEPDDVEYYPNFAIRGPARLPLTFKPRPSRAQSPVHHRRGRAPA